MKKKILNVLSVLLCGTMLVSFAACGGGGEELPAAAQGKTVLYVAAYEGGLGTQWITNAANSFAKQYEGVSLEDGKTGVYVHVQAHKSFNGNTLLTGTIDKDIYFTEDVNYFKHVGQGNFADITDIVTGSLSEYGEEGSIEDKLDKNQKDFLTAKDGKYYGLPFYDGIHGFIYDRDLFNANYWFFDADGAIGVDETGKNANGSDFGLSAGPDNNMETTYDNGLPATYAQFEELLYEIRAVRKVPFSYMGSDPAYIKRAMMNWWSDYEGLENMNVNYTLDGEVELVESISGDTVTTYTENIDQTNGYLLHKQAGKYYALSFLETLVDNPDNYKVNKDDHKTAQRKFVRGTLTNDDDFAMLVDGIWWENEARSILDDCGTEFGKGRMDRRFAFMPVPKANETELAKNQGQTLVSLNDSFAFVNAKSKKLDLAKKFMQFLHTDAQLSAFTSETSATRSFRYDVIEADEATMSYFGKSVLEMKRNSNIIYPCSNLTIINNNSATFTSDVWGWSTQIGATKYEDPFAAFRSGKTAKDYFEGYGKIFTATAWSAMNK